MPLSASIFGSEDITKIDFGSFSQSINSFVYIGVFPKLTELTLRNTNLITFVDGFAGQRLNLSNKFSQPILLIAGNASDCSITQPVVGSGNIKKIGTGKLSLRGVNLYSGTTEITEGVLEIETGVLGNGNYSGNISNAAQFSIITPTQQTISGIISGTGVINIGGNVSFVNDNTYSGGTSILAGGKLSISRQTPGSLTTASILNAGILDFAGSFQINVLISISGSGLVTKNGTNTVVLLGSNSYTGSTTINSGTLLFEKVFSLYSGTQANWTKDKIIVNSGAVFAINVGGIQEFATSDIAPLLLLASSINNNGFKSGSSIAFNTTNASGGTFTISNVIPDSTGTGSGAVGVKKLGTNELILSGTNTFTGQLFVSSGTLSVNLFNNDFSPGPLGAGSLPIDIGSLVESTIKYTGGAAASNKKLFLSPSGGIIEILNAITLEISGAISGTGTLKKTGIGTLVLSGSNSMSGQISVLAGMLSGKSSNAFGTAGNQISVADGSALQLQNNIAVNANVQLFGGGISTAGALRSSGTNTWTGNITINLASTRISSDAGVLTINGNIDAKTFLTIFQGNGNITVSGIISGSGGVTTSSLSGVNSILTLSSNNTFTGAISITKGAVSVSSIKNFGIASGLGAATSSVIPIGQTSANGTLIYTGTGDTSDRTIQIGGNSNPPSASDTGSATIQNDGSGALVFSAANFNNPSNAATGVGANRTLTLSGSNSGNNTISGIIRDNLVTAPATGTAVISLIKNGTGTWILSGANTFTGTTTVSSGYLIVSNASALGTIATATTVSSGATLRIQGNIALAAEPLTISGPGVTQGDGALANLSGTNSMSGAITMAADARINSIAGELTISGAINGAARTLTCGGAGTLTLSGIITLTTGGIVYDGAGVLILSNANSYTGGTSISNGAVRVSNASALGTSGTITVNSPKGQLEILGGITFARAVVIDGVGATSEGALVNRSGNNTFSGAITFGPGIQGSTAEIGSASGILTLSGNITGTGKSIIFDVASGAEIISTGQIALTVGTSQGNLSKQGVGTLTLSGSSNTYAGLTTVLAGILRITSLSSFGTSSGVIVNDGATLQIQPTVAGTFSKLTTISGNGVSSQGALNNTALNNTIGSGVLQVGSTTANRIASAAGLTLTINGITRNESLLFGAAAPLTFGGAGTITLSGAISTTGISGSSSLTKVDAGTLNLGNHAHNYNGSTTISAGTLTRVVTNGSTTATGTFVPTALAVVFTAVPVVGSTWKFFPADTTNTYATVSLVGAPGRTGTYNRTNSTLTIS